MLCSIAGPDQNENVIHFQANHHVPQGGYSYKHSSLIITPRQYLINDHKKENKKNKTSG